jgi:hypothetical protein
MFTAASKAGSLTSWEVTICTTVAGSIGLLTSSFRSEDAIKEPGGGITGVEGATTEEEGATTKEEGAITGEATLCSGMTSEAR